MCKLTVSNVLFMSSATVIVRSGGLLRWCCLWCVVLVEWLLLKPCCVAMWWMLSVMYGSSVFSRLFAITERSEMGLYDEPMFMSQFGFGIMFACFHV